MDFENYECNGQLSIFDLTMRTFKITKPIRLIELFAGYGSQAMALDVISADYEHYKVVEFDKYAVQSYNAVHNTNFEPMDIRNVHGKDLEIINTEQFTYMLTYSFPCTDLSVAGKMQGMTKGSGTRSGLLWEVERLLNETDNLPQVLLMENVPQVHGKKNMDDFQKWIDFLSSKGYSNYWQDLNAKNFGVAQNRNRCFMVSLLGNYKYEFPEGKPLDKTMKDYLEDEVDEKYYINSEKVNKLIRQLVDNGSLENGCVGNVNPSGNGLNGNVYSGNLAPTLTTNKGEGQKIVEVNQVGNIADKKNFENPQTGRVYATDGCAPTLNTCSGGGHEPKIVAMRGRNPDNPSDRATGSPTEQRLEPNSQGLCNTITSVQKDNMLLIKQATKDGYIECKLGGVADLSYPNSETRRGRVQENGEVSPTITATETGICRIESIYRIRKLTPRECGRLMAVSDRNIDKILSVVSNSQAYKQFGNSIVVMCMVAMFSNLNIQGLPNWDEIKHKYFNPQYRA